MKTACRITLSALGLIVMATSQTQAVEPDRREQAALDALSVWLRDRSEEGFGDAVAAEDGEAALERIEKVMTRIIRVVSPTRYRGIEAQDLREDTVEFAEMLFRVWRADPTEFDEDAQKVATRTVENIERDVRGSDEIGERHAAALDLAARIFEDKLSSGEIELVGLEESREIDELMMSDFPPQLMGWEPALERAGRLYASTELAAEKIKNQVHIQAALENFYTRGAALAFFSQNSLANEEDINRNIDDVLAKYTENGSLDVRFIEDIAWEIMSGGAVYTSE